MPAPLILAPLGTELSAREVDFFREVDPWGFILFARNLESSNQIKSLCNDLRASLERDAPILIDQEGGRVQRLRPPLAREWRPPLDDATRLGPNAARGIYLRHRLIAHDLLTLGIDVNCAPTLDIASAETHPFLRNRCYAETPERVAELGQAAADGLLAGGVLPVIKHMPGHGRTRVDSHLNLPRSDQPLEALWESDFAPFKAMADAPLGMTAHIVMDAVDPDRPATQSPAALTLIREEIGFGGLLMTDDISMEALEGSVADRGTRALEAGCDVVLHCNGDMAEMEALAAVCPPMSTEAHARGAAALAMRRPPEDDDIDALAAEYAAMG